MGQFTSPTHPVFLSANLSAFLYFFYSLFSHIVHVRGWVTNVETLNLTPLWNGLRVLLLRHPERLPGLPSLQDCSVCFRRSKGMWRHSAAVTIRTYQAVVAGVVWLLDSTLYSRKNAIKTQNASEGKHVRGFFCSMYCVPDNMAALLPVLWFNLIKGTQWALVWSNNSMHQHLLSTGVRQVLVTFDPFYI